MASYLRESERLDGLGLPSIRRSGMGMDSSLRRSLTNLNDSDFPVDKPHVRFTNSPPTTGLFRERTSSPILHRPQSPSQGRRLSELQDQLRMYKEELKKKDTLITHLSTSSSPNGLSPSGTQRSLDLAKLEALFGADRMTSESARGEAAALQVKCENLQAQIRDLQAKIDNRDGKIRDQNREIDTLRENEARHSSLVLSLRNRLQDVEGQTGSLEAVAGRSELAISTLQKDYRDAQERILELESRLKKHLEDKEHAEQEMVIVDKKYRDLHSQVFSILRLDDDLFGSSSFGMETIASKLTDIVTENATLKGRLVTLETTLQNTELETKASRETIMRLVSEVGREQKSMTRVGTEAENIRVERDNALAIQRELEREIESLNQRLESTQRAWNATRGELTQHENRFGHLDREARERTLNCRTAESSLLSFKEQLSTLLSDGYHSCPPHEENIRERIKHLKSGYKDRDVNVDMLEGKLKKAADQLQNQYDLQKRAEDRAVRAEADVRKIGNHMQTVEGDIAAGEVFRDGLRADKEKYLRFMEKMAEVMKMDRISAEIGFDMNGETLVSRAQQLVKLEADSLADRSTHIYNLQRKIKAMKQQLESKDLHLDLLRKKLVSLEERSAGRSEIERERDGETMKVRKMHKQIERHQQQLVDARIEITDLKAQLLNSSDLKIATLEQNKEIEHLEKTVNQLEKVRHKQAKKIANLKQEFDVTQDDTAERSVSSQNAVQALSQELRSRKQAHEEASKRERSLVDFRNVIARMLGLDINSLAIPDYEIISRLEKLIQAHHTHSITTGALGTALDDLEDGFQVGYSDARLLLNNTSPRRSRSPTRGQSPYRHTSPARIRTRSLSPTRRDKRSY